ncbi:MAG: response regulator, partial [Pseudomonadota bacterium]|nr:response regulator [Pseudomonadota bacterium]
VHGLASQLGGALTLSSKPGLGTRVELWLPATDETPGAALEVADTGAGKSAPAGTVLLVDDEPLVRASTADMLSDLGYKVVEAESGKQAIVLFGEQRFDMLVTDHLMPGLSGTDLARQLRMQRPDLPVLVVSGYADIDGITPDLPRLTKPFRQADLAASIAAIKGEAG